MDGLTMHAHYSNEHSSAEIVKTTIKGAEGVLELVRVWTDVEARRQGYATDLMMAIIDDADAGSDVLMLSPKPFGSGKGIKELAKWYKRFGFVVIQKEPLLMARMPQADKQKMKIGEALETTNG